MYRIREVDGDDDDIAETLAELHRLTFFDTAPVPPFDQGHWWLAFRGSRPVAFAGIVPSTRTPRTGYFCRVGVLRRYCGNGLQLRLMRAVEWRARRNGWRWVVSDTTHKRRISQQLHSWRLPAVSASMPMGLVAYAVLAEIRHVNRHGLISQNLFKIAEIYVLPITGSCLESAASLPRARGGFMFGASGGCRLFRSGIQRNPMTDNG
jgi:GNAT superfamily N-acetyltransferase